MKVRFLSTGILGCWMLSLSVVAGSGLPENLTMRSPDTLANGFVNVEDAYAKMLDSDTVEDDRHVLENKAGLPDYMQLPFPEGESWIISPAHVDNWEYLNDPRNSLDFSDGYWNYGEKPVSAVVVASGPGRAYWGCPCFLEIDHGDGWTSTYYHMDPEHQLVKNGDQVRVNQPVGRYADTFEEAVCCGGGTDYQHLHWSIWNNGQAVSVEGLVLSGWTVHAGDSNYDENCDRSYFERDGEKRCPWDPILNEGAGDSDTDSDVDSDFDSDTTADTDEDVVADTDTESDTDADTEGGGDKNILGDCSCKLISSQSDASVAQLLLFIFFTLGL